MDLDWTTIRRNVLPAIGAVVLAAGLWFGAGPLLSGGDPEPVPEPEPAAPVAEVVVEVVEPEPEPEPQATRPTVLVTTQAIGAGTLLSDEHMEFRELDVQERLGDMMVQGAVPMRAVVGAIAIRPMEAGDPVTWSSLLVPDHPGYISAVLDPDMVAVTIEANTPTNIIYPGDRVDIIMVTTHTGSVVSNTVIHDSRVLAVGTAVYSLAHYGRVNVTEGIQVDPPPLPSGSSYTLELTARDAERIAVAARIGNLTLAVRPTFADGRDANWHRAPTRVNQVMPQSPQAEARSVRVIRGVDAGPPPEQGL